MRDCVDRGCLNLEACNALENNYTAVILRFFEGDVPMMFVSGDTVSGTGKRESLSEAFSAHPFTYSFRPIPSTEEGGYFLNTISMEFAVNRNCENLDMTNEFMRFLISTAELNEMAKVKRLMTTSSDLSLDGMFAAFGELDEAQTLYEPNLGLLDDAITQTRRASWQVANGLLSVDEAVAAFGTL